MGIIRILPEQVVNKIAAGEVIERPASILKELIENALDAGADSIEMTVLHGGKSLVRVADNGCGMSAQDAELAFRSHATSKIAAAADLENIVSFGFRGEALPSIAAVSRVKMVTRADGKDTGTEVTLAGGHLEGARECAGAKGTAVEVRDLFFNTPARRKFLKSDATEMGHVLDIVSHLALSNLGVRFLLEAGGKKVLNVVAGEALAVRVAQVLGTGDAGSLLDIDTEANGIRVHGLIGKPGIARANRSGQVLFVNRRLVRSIGIGYALQDGYHGLVMHDRFPAAVLFIEIDPAKVDVNVHPTKQEVRLSNESEIKSLIRKTVAERLEKEGDLSPSMRLPSASRPYEASTRPFRPDFFKEAVSDGATSEIAEVPAAAFYQPSGPESGTAVAEPDLLKTKWQVTRVLGQVHNTFILVETEEGMMIVDQHAAHERVMFEAILKNFQSDTPQRQTLLLGEVLELPLRQMDLFRQSLPFLGKAGFEIEEFGENAFIVHSVPAAFGDESAAATLKTFLEEREEGKVTTELEKQPQELAALIACKRRAVKAHDAMSPTAVRTLLEQLATCENPFTCPHGRPTFFKQSVSDLEKYFKRK